MPLREAIHRLSPANKWTSLTTISGGREDDAIESLSGRPAGRLLLLSEIANQNLYAADARKDYRDFEKLRTELIDAFDAKRKEGMVLKGYTAASPGRPTTIPLALTLKYDFANGTAQNGDLKFFGVTVSASQHRPDRAAGGLRQLAVSDAELRSFCKGYLDQISPPPSMDALRDAARQKFPDKNISRARIREMHRTFIPAQSRKPGPRK